MTGAGGWLGGEIAGRLADAGAAVTALVRRNTSVLRNDGSPAPISRTLNGDIAQPRFGWDARQWTDVAHAHDLIVHCAALTQFGADPALTHAVNVGGTAAVLALAEAGGSGLLHISTAYVNGVRSGVVLETQAPEGPFTNDYEASKAAAETLVRRSAIPFVIARPSIVLGDWAEGRVRQFGTFYFLLKALGEGWVKRMPAEPDATLDLVPVDHVAAGVVDLAERFAAAAGGTFHLVSGAPTPMAAFPETLSRFPGLAVPEFVTPDTVPTGRAFNRLIAPYAPYFRRDPRFDDAGFSALTGRACPAIGPGWWERLLAFAIAAGFVGSGAQASRSGPNGIANDDAIPSSAGSR